MAVEIRKMEERDIPPIVSIEKKSFLSPWPFEELSTRFKVSNNHYLVAKEEEAVLGYVECEIVADECRITRLAVDPLYRGKGIGKRLVRAVLDSAEEWNINNFLLEVRASNIISQNLYKGLGFKEVGKRKRYYSDTGEDALIMEKKIGTNLN